MRFDDVIQLQIVATTEDERFNEVETTTFAPIGNGKKIPNGSASLRDGEDGKTYSYSMTVFLRNPSIRPKEGDIVRIFDNTAKESFDAKVDGVSVLPKKYVKLFVTKLTESPEETVTEGETEGAGGSDVNENGGEEVSDEQEG